ncbi:unnamed protein product, partial [marine sediment metagenome]
MGGINGTSLKADAMEGGLYDYILLSMNAPAYLMPCPRWYIHLISQAAKLKTVLKSRRSAIVAGSQDVFIPHCHCPYVVPAA